jgi:hypothetical protein
MLKYLIFAFLAQFIKSDEIFIFPPIIENRSRVNLSYKIERNGMLYTEHYNSELRNMNGDLIWTMITDQLQTNLTYTINYPGNYKFTVYSYGQYLVNTEFNQELKYLLISENVNFNI